MDFRNLKIKDLGLKDAVVVILFILFLINCIDYIIPYWGGIIFFVIYGVLRLYGKDENTIENFDERKM